MIETIDVRTYACINILLDTTVSLQSRKQSATFSRVSILRRGHLYLYTSSNIRLHFVPYRREVPSSLQYSDVLKG